MRLVDVIAGVSKDSTGRIIQDPSAGSADINAVAALHHTGNVKGTGPTVTLDLPLSGNFTLGISDPGGLSDLDPNSLRVALGGNLPTGWLLHLSVSVRDKTGYRSGQSRVR